MSCLFPCSFDVMPLLGHITRCVFTDVHVGASVKAEQVGAGVDVKGRASEV